MHRIQRGAEDLKLRQIHFELIILVMYQNYTFIIIHTLIIIRSVFINVLALASTEELKFFKNIKKCHMHIKIV